MPKTSQTFWSKFAKLYWEKKPALLKRMASPLFEMDSEYIFELLVRYSNNARKHASTQGLKLYVDGQPLNGDEILEFLPDRKDKSLEDYHRRMGKRFNDYCLVCDELLQVSREKWDLLADFMQGLYEQVGLPNRFAEIGLYLGNYRKTPFGVHVDGCGVFSIPVVGTKKFRLWDPEFVAKNPDLNESFHYKKYEKYSTLITAKPGDITYWPSTYYHIAESAGSFSATWSIGVWLDLPYLEVLLQMMKSLLLQKLKNDGNTRVLPFKQMDELPGVMKRSAKILCSITEGEWKQTFLKSWGQMTKKRGFKNCPRKLN